MDYPYKIDNGRVGQERDVPGGSVAFWADGIRKERTGVHATVYILYKGNGQVKVLAWSNMNIERSSDRSKLCRDGYQKVGAILKGGYPLPDLVDHFDNFCMGLFEASMKIYKPEYLEGNMNKDGQDFILKPYVMNHAGTILFAPPGRGKSYVGLLMAISIDSGNYNIWPVNQKKVMFINLERSARSIGDRIGAINHSLGLPVDRPLFTFSARGRSLSEIKQRCERAIKEENVEVILLDSISRTGFGTLVEDRPANQIIDTLNFLCPTWIGIGHTPRGDEGHIYGSVMFDAGIDVGVQIITESSDDKLGVGLKITKANDIRKPKELDVLSLKFSETGLTKVRRAENGEFLEIENSRGLSDWELVKEHLRRVGKDFVGNISTATGVNKGNVSRILHNTPRVFVEINKDGNKVYWGLQSDRYEDAF